MSPQFKGLSLGFALVLGTTLACASNSSTVQSEPKANAREAGAPDSVDNKNLPPKPQSDPAAVNAREAYTPVSPDNKNVSGVPPTDPAVHKEEIRAAEAGNPDSVDSSLPPSTVIIQRVYLFDQAAIEAGHAAEQNGGPGGVAFGKRIVRERTENAQRLSDLAGKNHTSLLDKDLTADQKTRAFAKSMKDENDKLTGLSGLAFDRVFSKHFAHVAERDLKEVARLRTRCADAQVCAMLDGLVPVLERERDDARALSTAAAMNGPVAN